jgi:carboxypeptidase family protein
MYQRTPSWSESGTSVPTLSPGSRRLVSWAHRATFCCLLLIISAVTAAAQTGTGGTIGGTITDPSGAAVPNVDITITNTDTNTATHIKSNDRGEYLVPDLPVGHYKVRAEAAGFKAVEQTNISLNVGERARVDLGLEVGSTQESITVEANAVQVQSESGEVSSVITGQQMTQLATNGRSVYSLATLTPGASSNMSDLNIPTSAGGDASVSFNGLRQNHNLWLVDGGEASDRGGAGGMDVMPSIDAIGEFRALTSNYSAEFGLSSGGTLTMIVKSGTKDFHASAWEFNRNDALDAANFINNANGVKTPELRFNTYGFNVGGPVFIPKVYNKDKDKTFFFLQHGMAQADPGRQREHYGSVNKRIWWQFRFDSDQSSRRIPIGAKPCIEVRCGRSQSGSALPEQHDSCLFARPECASASTGWNLSRA